MIHKGEDKMDQQEDLEKVCILSSEEVAEIEARKQAAILAAQATTGTTTKRVRLSIDFHITIAGVPPDNDGMNKPDPVYHARQARLLAAVKSNSAVLRRWIGERIANQMQQKDWSYWEDMLVGGDIAFQDLLAPALAVLPEDDREYFAFIPKDLYFDDMIDLFSASFSVKEDAPVLQMDE